MLELDDEGQELVKELGAAINEAVEKSPRVMDAIDNMRVAGYVMDLTIRLEIALQKIKEEKTKYKNDEVQLDLTAEDLRTLRQMKIRIDDDM